MKLLDSLEIKLGRYSIKNITLIIVICQSIVFFAMLGNLISIDDLSLTYQKIGQGQIWRVISFLFIPPTLNPIFVLFNWYFFYLMGTSLEHYWGTFHYNIYILIGIILTNLLAFVLNINITTNIYFESSIFLAFAFLNPNFQLRLFFLIPVKIKWFALLIWIGYIWTIVTGSYAGKLLIVVSLLNFFIFFFKDIYYKIRYRKNRVKERINSELTKNKPLHTCSQCGVTDKDDPYMEFRYCSKCSPERCYCEEHINNHDH